MGIGLGVFLIIAGTPPVAGAKYHQVMWAATLDTSLSPVRKARPAGQ